MAIITVITADSSTEKALLIVLYEVHNKEIALQLCSLFNAHVVSPKSNIYISAKVVESGDVISFE
jgi:hypothetical protein